MDLPIGCDKWKTIYPLYVDAARTKSEGRRLPRGECCNEPKIDEVESVLKKMGLVADESYLRQDKIHPRVPYKWPENTRGSVRLNLDELKAKGHHDINKAKLLKLISNGIQLHREELKKIRFFTL